jgi:catechol 2,3-dioxygenase-like lactoylglutathione lyase family enzyme
MAIAHFTLATRDVHRSSAFFAETFGWQPIRRPGNAPVPTAWLEIAPGQELHLVYVADFEPSPFEEEFGRHFAVSYPAEDFVGLQERLVRHGARLIEPRRETPFPRFFFRDPNGYVFEVVAEKRSPEM